MSQLIIDQLFFGACIVWAIAFLTTILLADLQKASGRVWALLAILWVMGISWLFALWLIK